MTSSFNLPGGGLTSLFRAEPVIILDNQQTQSTTSARRGKMPTRWVHLNGSSSPDSVAPEPPSRAADYVGQIIAVAAPSAAIS